MKFQANEKLHFKSWKTPRDWHLRLFSDLDTHAIYIHTHTQSYIHTPEHTHTHHSTYEFSFGYMPDCAVCDMRLYTAVMARRGYQILWSNSYLWLWAALPGCLEQNSGSLLEQELLLTTESSFSPPQMHFDVKVCLLLVLPVNNHTT